MQPAPFAGQKTLQNIKITFFRSFLPNDYAGRDKGIRAPLDEIWEELEDLEAEAAGTDAALKKILRKVGYEKWGS